MEISVVLLCVTLAASVTPVSSAAEPGIIESLLLATNQRPWLWGVYVFTVGLPIILFISLMWPDKRFGPPDEEYYYKKCDDAQPDSLDTSPPPVRKAGETVARRRETKGNQKKSDLES
ncbi:unnamed protein product [Pleuronectes platessa]|uniref:Calnexin n=1 Tax=Pleuronectes platessa TaxID=8262 RepID=A0A9N7VT62_PLEPL|nr:unnamed protein product [Pleuronectes platessa]